MVLQDNISSKDIYIDKLDTYKNHFVKQYFKDENKIK